MGSNFSVERDILIPAAKQYNVGDYVYPSNTPANLKNQNNLWIVDSKPTQSTLIIRLYNNPAYKKEVNALMITKTTAPKNPPTYVKPVQILPATAPKPPPAPVVPPAYPDLSDPTTNTSFIELPIFSDSVESFVTTNIVDQDKILSNQDSTYTNENALLSEIITFNTLYAQYIHCQNDAVNRDPNSRLGNCSSVSTKGPDYDPNVDINYAPSAGKITSQITNKINPKLAVFKSGSDYNFATVPTGTNHNDLIANNKDNMALRAELDAKLKELYRTEDSISNEYKKNYDSTMYSGILLTALATSILYYVFVKI